jgi:hypothetical protein
MEICHYNSRMSQRLSYPLPKEDGVIDSPFLGKKAGWGYDGGGAFCRQVAGYSISAFSRLL